MNLFLPVYKRLEEDVISLADTIFFDDNQLSTYSLTIGDLLIRCVIEVEAISKELYLRLGGAEEPLDDEGNKRQLYYDTDCIKLLADTWGINKKNVQITNPNMYFSPKKAILTPLHKSHKRGTSSSGWQQAYQGFKHYRTRSIKKATIENLLNALGALYILNLYYTDEKFWSETVIKDRREYVGDSKIFTPFVADATHFQMGPNMGDDKMDEIENPSLDESVFVLKNTEESFRAIQKAFCKFNANIVAKVQMSDDYKDHIKQHPTDAQLGIDVLCQRLGVNYMLYLNQEIRVWGSPFHRLKEKEVVLNKNNGIYPTLTYFEFLDSDEGQKYMAETVASLNGRKITLPK